MVDPLRVQFTKKKIFSFVAPTGKSRGDRVYINEANINSLSGIKYINTTFNSSHKIMTFNLQRTREIGPSTWKMNSSVLHDELYIKEVEEVFHGVTQLNIVNPIRRWHLFHMVTEGITIHYTQRKAGIQNAIKTSISNRLQTLETLDFNSMSVEQKKEYLYCKDKYKEIIYKEIQGHQIRTRGHPRYEINEPDIDFYTKLEKRYQNKNIIMELKDENDIIHSDTEKLLETTEKFYKKLYSPSKTNKIKQQQLLKNIDKKLKASDRHKLDAPLSEEELSKATFQLHDGKSPGLDGKTAEFYKTFWFLIKDLYIEYINAARDTSFTDHQNTSVTTLIYKHKGEIYILDNYRPISLINVDLKILAKALANRLKPILPTIIHQSQTAVDTRRIDYTIHMLRDLIDLTEKEDDEAAFLFIDQEKAFDSTDHDLLFMTMESFGFGDYFIKWIKVLYSNASTQIKINGFLTNKIPLRRGLRQGCPLSMMLYVIFIELLALQLRKNPNLIGFKIGGEKIISLHYADDAIIIIKQNQCFKEVIKDLDTYQSATGAKVNYTKTKGLWVGKWKDRTDKPLNIKWTNKNIKRLGVYFGNDNPAKHTFQEIRPKIIRSMNFWKQFALSKLAKSRVTEIFHASRLWFAATFYDIPTDIIKQLHNEFVAYINFPNSTPTVKQEELQKLRLDGGLKLIDIKCKADTYKIRWLLELSSDENLATHLNLLTTLLGKQKGGLDGTDFLFATRHYIDKILNTNSCFYKTAFQAIRRLQPKKKIIDPKNEKVFYNPTFKSMNQLVIKPNKTCEDKKTFTYGSIMEEYEKEQNKQPHNKHVSNIYRKIIHKDLENRDHNEILNPRTNEYVPFEKTTHKSIYEYLIFLHYKDHHCKDKWETYLGNTNINWDNVWKSLSNPISTEDTKTIIWEQIHLNSYTTYSYNKWHKSQQNCPFCTQVPANRFHITHECTALTSLWTELEPHLKAIHPVPLSNTEKAFGLHGHSPSIILRNWMTFLLRETIADQERIGYYNQKGLGNVKDIKLAYNQNVKTEVWVKYNIYKHLGRTSYFESIFAYKDYLIIWENDNWQILTLFT